MSLPKRKLKEIVTGIFDCPHSTPKWTSSGVLVIRNFNVKNGKLVLDKPSFTDEGTFIGRTRRAVPSAGDLILTREAPMGEICMVPINMKCCLGQRVVLIRPDSNKVYPPYLLYAFLSDQIQHQIRMSEGTGSVVSNLRIPHIEDLEFVLPDYKIQKQIASILSCLDDKIELNRRMNQTLEQIAATLFKKYFVDDIDPDNLPDEWQWSKVGKLITVQNGYAFKSKEFQETGDIGILKIKNINNNVVDIHHTQFVTREIVSELNSKFSVKSADMLIAMTGAEVGKIGIVPTTNKRLYLNQRVGSFKDVIEFGKYYSFVLLMSEAFQEELQTTAMGSAQPNISSSDIENIKCILPPIDLVRAFGKEIKPMFDMICKNHEQNYTLSIIRNTLLPKLMSGEIDLSTITQNEELHAGVLS